MINDATYAHRGQTYLVTGASSGIGRATSILLAARGAKVALVGRNAEALEATRAQMDGHGHTIWIKDFLDEDGGKSLPVDVSNEMGKLNGVVHCAGVHAVTPVRSVKPRQVNDLFAANITSALGVISGFRNKRVRAERSSVVLMSSVAGLVGEAGVSAYAASKGAIVSLTKSLALELASEGIRVNCLNPGIVETPMMSKLRSTIGEAAYEELQRQHPLGLGHPNDVAEAASFMLSEKSRWMTGSAVVLDGGYSLG